MGADACGDRSVKLKDCIEDAVHLSSALYEAQALLAKGGSDE